MSLDLDAYRAASLAQWESSAPGWATHRELVQRGGMPVSEWLIDAVGPQPGQTVLELAAGTGETGFLAAELVRPSGTLVCSDFAAPMLDAARERAAELGLDNVEFRTLNAESLDLPAASVDAILCRWGFMLMADPAAALGESRRVVRPGGRLALAAWDAADRNPWASLMGAELRRQLGAPDPDPALPGMFAFALPGRIQELLDGAGFTEARVETVAVQQAFASFEDWWDTTMDLAQPLAALVAHLDTDRVSAARDALREAVAPYADAEGRLVFPGSSLVAAATA